MDQTIKIIIACFVISCLFFTAGYFCRQWIGQGQFDDQAKQFNIAIGITESANRELQGLYQSTLDTNANLTKSIEQRQRIINEQRTAIAERQRTIDETKAAIGELGKTLDGTTGSIQDIIDAIRKIVEYIQETPG